MQRSGKVWIAILVLLLVVGAWVASQTLSRWLGPSVSLAQAPMDPAALAKKVEAYYRNLFALGSQVPVVVSPPQPATVPGLLQVTLSIGEGPNANRETALITPDGRFLLRGEMRDTTKDPYADARAAIKLADQPARGPADAPVTLVLYSDFQCPYCREMYNILDTKVLKRHPEVRLVYKDFPLVQIHPWAMTAAIAGQCAYTQSNAGFWQLYTDFFEYQKEINPQNIEKKLDGFAAAAGLDLPRFKACVAKNEVRTRLQDSFRESQALGLDSTPTMFINGRRLVGNVPEPVIERVILYELEQAKQSKTETKPKS